MRRAAVLLVLVTALGLAPGCGAPPSEPAGPPVFGTEPIATLASLGGRLMVTVWTAPSPPRKGVNDLRLRVVDAGGAAVTGVVMRATAWMPAHGHGASVKPAVTEVGEGVYDLARVVFFMDGRWELRADATQPAGEGDSFVATFDVL